MSTPIQKTKLFPPAVRPRMIERRRLLERLDRVLEEGCRLALISAPAGSGKTTVAAQWLRTAPCPTVWISLDARDDTPAGFFAYLVASWQGFLPTVGSEALELLKLPRYDLNEVVLELVNDLAESPDRLVVALDDFHSLQNPAVHRAVDALLDALPRQVRLLILTREDPNLSLARRRARGELVELRQDDLRFTLPEALAFLNQTMGLSLTAAQAEALEARTEGWIAGLQMAAISLQNAPDPDGFIRAFSGSHRFILDYLVEEVLAQQPEEIQRFLLATSILERMCADLGSALTGQPAGWTQQVLETLARSNLFIVPLDDERIWFRYHHLFSDLLRVRAANAAGQFTSAAGLPDLYRRASDWYEANGEPRLAVEFALKAGDPQRAAGLIETHIVERWQTVDLEFHMLLDRLPPEVIAARPGLCLQSAWLCVITGQPDRIPPLLAAAEQILLAPGRAPAPGDAAQLAFARILHAYLDDFANRHVNIDAALEQAVAAIPTGNPGMHNSVAVVIGSICFLEGDFERAKRYFDAAIELDRRVNGTNAVPIATSRMVMVLRAQGQLRAAEKRLTRALDYVEIRGKRRFYISGILNVHLGEILLEWNRLEEAEAQIREGLRLLEDWRSLPGICHGLSLLARLHAVRGELAEAQAALARAEALTRETRFHSLFTVPIERARVHLLIAAGDSAALEAWAAENAHLAQGEVTFRHMARLIELCRAWLALGRTVEAAQLLERLLAAAQNCNGTRLQILALLSVARFDDPERAVEFAVEALRLAHPEGYLRTFLDGGETLRAALEGFVRGRSTQDEALVAYARQILTAWNAAESHTGEVKHPASLVEPLSPRELEVLRLVTKGLTNQQIADRLVISIRTVKKHIGNIHGKVGAQNRTQAAARARELGLL